MARQLFNVERGLRTTGVNSDSGVNYLFGSALPGGDGGDQDASEVGSLYIRTGSGQLFQKKTSTNSAADWQEIVTASALKWRQESVIAATSQAAPSSGSSINLTSSPLTGDESPTLAAGDFSVDDHILFGVGGTPKLMRVSAISSPSITVVDILDNLVNGDMMFVKYYLLDTPDGQEKAAILAYVGTAIQKISDINWDLADGINLNGSVTDRQGPVLGNDTVQVAIEKLEGDCKDQASLNGVSRGAVDLGTFTGKAISDNTTVKNALQQLETAMEARTQQATVTTITTLDSVLVDVVKMAKWLVHVFEEATPANQKIFEITAMHNGTDSADATATDDTIATKLTLGSNFNIALTVDINGSGGSQVMRLRVASTSAGVTATARRIEVY